MVSTALAGTGLVSALRDVIAKARDWPALDMGSQAPHLPQQDPEVRETAWCSVPKCLLRP